MRKCGLGAVQQRGIVVLYDDVIVGEFTADPGRGPGHRRTQGGQRADRRAHSTMPELPARHRQAAMPADQLRPAQSRNPPCHPLTRVLARPSLIASAIPFIPAYPSSSALKKRLPPPPAKGNRSVPATRTALATDFRPRGVGGSTGTHLGISWRLGVSILTVISARDCGEARVPQARCDQSRHGTQDACSLSVSRANM
jgi:hypothetical protein